MIVRYWTIVKRSYLNAIAKISSLILHPLSNLNITVKPHATIELDRILKPLYVTLLRIGEHPAPYTEKPAPL